MKNILLNFIDEAHYLLYCLRHSVQSFFSGIKNVCLWFKVCYQDRWYDESFFWIILRFKLRQMERGHTQDGHLEVSLETARGIRRCLNILDRLVEDRYPFENYTVTKQQDIDELFLIMREKVQDWSD